MVDLRPVMESWVAAPDTLEEANDYGELSSPRSVSRPPFSEEPFDPNCAEDWERLLGYREPAA